MALAYLSIGSNLGQRKEYLGKAIIALEQNVGTLLKCSDFIETEPWGFTSDNKFLNAALILETKLLPWDLFHKTQEIEQEIGRKKKSVNNAYSDRCIDIDILFYDHLIVENTTLTIPHPKLHQRMFVLQPLNQIAPDFVHPQLDKTIHQLFLELRQNEK